jgi:proline iminopeptidase
MVLAGVATTATRDLRWLYGDVGAMFPEAYSAFCAHLPETDPDPARTHERIAAYDTRLRLSETAQAAADAWCTWESAIFGASIHDSGSRFGDPAFRLGFARIVAHYFVRNAWFDDDQLLRDAHLMAHIPATLIHSRFDPSCPLRGPWELAQVWPQATLKILGGTTHSALDMEFVREIRAATDALNFRAQLGGMLFGTGIPPFLHVSEPRG